MTALGQALNDYLRLRRRLGYDLERDQPQLEQFVAFLERAGAQRITTELALRWARIPATEHAIIWRKRLSMVRQFARYLATVDPLSEIPPQDLLPAHQPRIAPYIYAPQEIEALVAAARSLRRPLAAAMFATVLGLLASTGLRLREALALDRTDVDLHDGVLDIRACKNHRQREVPLHPSATAALLRYAGVRDERFPNVTTPAFFVTSRGRRPVKTVFQPTFRVLIAQAGLVAGVGQQRVGVGGEVLDADFSAVAAPEVVQQPCWDVGQNRGGVAVERDDVFAAVRTTEVVEIRHRGGGRECGSFPELCRGHRGQEDLPGGQ